MAANNHKVVVEEALQAPDYTYLQVTENGEEKWLAVSKTQAKEGDVLYYASGLEMKNFESKKLKRTFPTIYFVNQISEQPIVGAQKETMVSPHGKAPITPKEDIKVSPAKDGITLEKLYSNKDQYSGKSVIVKGQVVKYNAQIMGKNWVHIQDGTKAAENYDLAITTTDVVKVGDVVTFKGTISLNKDFGAGYSYAVIMEEATLEKN